MGGPKHIVDPVLISYSILSGYLHHCKEQWQLRLKLQGKPEQKSLQLREKWRLQKLWKRLQMLFLNLDLHCNWDTFRHWLIFQQRRTLPLFFLYQLIWFLLSWTEIEAKILTQEVALFEKLTVFTNFEWKPGKRPSRFFLITLEKITYHLELSKAKVLSLDLKYGDSFDDEKVCLAIQLQD